MKISGYHAHIYFTDQTYDRAYMLCHKAGQKFALKVGHMHRNPVGPHTGGSCQLSFKPAFFNEVTAWLELNRDDLSVLIHPLTGDDLADHTEHALWLGEPQQLRLENL